MLEVATTLALSLGPRAQSTPHPPPLAAGPSPGSSATSSAMPTFPTKPRMLTPSRACGEAVAVPATVFTNIWRGRWSALSLDLARGTRDGEPGEEPRHESIHPLPRDSAADDPLATLKSASSTCPPRASAFARAALFMAGVEYVRRPVTGCTFAKANESPPGLSRRLKAGPASGLSCPSLLDCEDSEPPPAPTVATPAARKPVNGGAPSPPAAPAARKA